MEQEVEKLYHKVINAAVALNSQYIFNQGNFQNEKLIEAREKLRKICTDNGLKMVILPDGEDAVLLITTKDTKQGILQITMNIMTPEDFEE